MKANRTAHFFETDFSSFTLILVQSMFEVARKIYIVEKRGSIDHNLNVGTPPGKWSLFMIFI